MPSPVSPIISAPTRLHRTPSKFVLPRRPPSLRPDSPASLYSIYSFYQLDCPSSAHISTDFTFTPSPDPGPDLFDPEKHGSMHFIAGPDLAFDPEKDDSINFIPSPELDEKYDSAHFIAGPDLDFDPEKHDSMNFIPSPDLDEKYDSAHFIAGPDLDSEKHDSMHFIAGPDPDPEKWQSLAILPPLPEPEAHHLLHLGIQYHEANRLEESAECFEKSAKEDGGCSAGMLMYGLTLRHGWGCEKNEEGGFMWLRSAVEKGILDLESWGGIDQGALRLAVYEVGQCFFHGWGVLKDKKTGVIYYRVAAGLGDADAQNDLGFCLANGKGCKKDRKEAAKWYRAAVEQGLSDVGLAWIYKKKFQ